LREVSLNNALIVEGGALRGVFSTGVLDGFLEAQFNPFDFYLGVSSGATNLAAYLAGMIGRNYRIYSDYSLRPEFISLVRFLRGGHLLDLDWLWEITIREIRLDLPAIYTRNNPFIVVLTDVQTGQAVYKATTADNLEHVLKASSAMPIFYRHYPVVDGCAMTDGGSADALPVSEAIRRGAKRIMIIRSRHYNYYKQNSLSDYLLLLYLRCFPLLQRTMAQRARQYNDAVKIIRWPPEGITIVEVCPPENFRVSRLSQDASLLEEGYEQGRARAAEAIGKWMAT
jgi:predicted patatin/cPLA2 family phospholipase